MKKIILLAFTALTLVTLPRTSLALTTLTPGDLVVVTANATGTYPSTNGFDFVSRVDIDSGTVIYFTDKGWDGSLGIPFWRSGLSEGVVRYTAPTAITAGTIVHFDDSLIAGASGTWDMFSIDGATGVLGVASGSNVMDFATSGDNILVFQGTGASPSFIYGVGWAGATTWVSSGTPTSNNSWVPAPLTLGTNAISLGSPDNFQYGCGIPGFFSSGFLSSLANSSNWVNNTTPYSVSTCTFDVTQPNVTINQSVGQNDPTNNNVVSFTVVFSEAINPATFAAGDVVLSGTGTGSVGTPTTSDNITWTIPVTATGSGTIIASLAASTVTDVNGNPNLLATSTDNTITYDTTAPIISEVTAVTTPTNDTTPDYTFTTNEAGIITYGGSCSSSTTIATVGPNTITLNNLVDGTYTTCTITVTDGAGNISNILTLSSFAIDETPPQITITNPSVLPAITKTVTASTNEGTLTKAINAPGSTTCNGTLTFSVYTSTTFSAESDNTRTICYRAIDTAGNIAYALSSIINGIDTTAPTIALSSTTTSPLSSAPFTITITPSESITGLTTSDFTCTNCTVSLLTGTGPYTVTVTPTAAGALSITLPVSTVTDTAGNANTAASNTLSYTADFSIPVLNPVSISSSNTDPSFAKAGDTVTLSWTSDDAPLSQTVTIGGQSVTSTCTGTGPVNCTATLTIAALVPVAEGPLAFSIATISVAGTTTVTATTNSTTVTVDRVAPTAPFTITSVGGDTIAPYATADSTPDVVVTTTIGDTVTIPGFVCTPTPAVGTSVTCTRTTAYLPDGVYTITPTIADQAGNSTTGSAVSITVDTGAPSPLTTTATTSSATTGTISGTCEVGTTTVITSSTIVGSPLTVTCTGGTYTQPVTMTANPSNYTVTSTDGALNTTTVSGTLSFEKKIRKEGYRKTEGTKVEAPSQLGKGNLCDAPLILTQDMKMGGRNGRINNYSQATKNAKQVLREVAILQKHMNRLGFISGPEDGILGPLTDGAIKRMQKFLGTYQDGYVGPITRGLINNSCV